MVGIILILVDYAFSHTYVYIEVNHGAIAKAKDEILPTMVCAAQEDLLTKKEVMKKFGVCDTTLWHWRNKGYLEAVKAGRQVCYRRSEVERVIKLRVR